MDPSKELDKNLDEFKRISLDLANTGEDFTDEHRAVIPLSSLPGVNAIKYGSNSWASNRTLDREWIMSSACPFHMTLHRHWYIDFESVGSGKVRIANNEECSIRGIGSIQLKLHNGTIKTLTSVRYVLEMKRNLLFLGMLTRRGYTLRLKVAP
ncbi:Uncharacterized protein Adt_24299 [Abeliophyllum distichum]|uniref:Retrovirus-related Pol polyprotein from transposon TNT 1-94-like beta-barrel domain-containing protein n=1 Tax=Abeliophyllum distichum TaxID=126358 RepID=A0ABD1SEY7_9LAMI